MLLVAVEWCSSQTWLSRVQLKRRFSPSLHNPHCHHHHQLVQDPQYRFNPQQCLRLCSLLPPHPLPHCQTQVTDMFQLCKPWSGQNPGVLVSSVTMYHHHGRFSKKRKIFLGVSKSAHSLSGGGSVGLFRDSSSI